ncbi:MAG TPA: ABC transporter permease [Casimicrobiaceae bacterium]|nr:ABC transporter permease [Casimicrobiaceae bacterium]
MSDATLRKPRSPLVPAPSSTTAGRVKALSRNFLGREIRTRYLGSSTGLAWALIHPLALLAVYHFVFTTIFRATRFGDQSFIAFVAVALWPWLATQEALSRATVSLAGYAGLIRKAAFPQETIVYASVTATFTLHFVGYVLVLIVLRAFGEPIRFEGMLIAVPLWLILLVAVTGISLALSAVQVFMRDVEHVLIPFLMMFMFLTPILYPVSLVPESLRPWVAANPFGWVVTRMRDALLDGRLALQGGDLVAVLVAGGLFVGGLWTFRRLAPHFEDFI